MWGRRLRSNLLEKVKGLEADVKTQNGLFEPKASCPFCVLVFNQILDPLFFLRLWSGAWSTCQSSRKVSSCLISVRFRTLSYTIVSHSDRYGFILLFISKQYSYLFYKFIWFFNMWKLFCIVHLYYFYRWQMILILAGGECVFRISIAGDDKYAVI